MSALGVRRYGAAALLACLAACGGPRPPWTEPPLTLDLRAELAPGSVPLLGTATLTLDLFWRSDLAVDFTPALPDGCRGSILAAPAVPFGNGNWQRTVVLLQPVRGPGDLAIGPFVARTTDGSADAKTPALQLHVTSLLGDAGAALEAPAPPIPAPSRAWLWIIAIAVALAAAYFGVRWWRRRPAAPPPHARPLAPHVKALRALARLRDQRPTTPAEVAAFYVEVSQVLRVYLEERFGLRAPERTTEEFLLELEQPVHGGVLDDHERRELRRFLSQCDLVKFAAQVPGADVHAATFAIAERFVEATRPDRHAAAAPAAAEVAS